MPVIEWAKDDNVAIVTMKNGENRHNPQYIAEFLDTFDSIGKNPSISAVVITSNDAKCWSLGIDVDWIMKTFQDKDFQAIKDFMYGLNMIFTRILLYPMPVIASISGHAFGNGAIMACACDFRFMREDRGFFCFPEIDINIPFLPGMIAVVQKTIPLYKFEELVYTGKRATAKELEAAHAIIQSCADTKELSETALSFAKTFHKKRPIFGEMKKRINAHILETMEKKDPEYIESLKLLM